ncbi:DUF5053 domain-containing protein [Ornithobacterium rhinotracheale]|uniref:DUF5053 domain-containing protein n=1 Tax=Ornithobacterium rhinotracheale TaxID=28251 RepID=UPI00129C2BC9|nr:DUF5053 domain-containing protein [Ornithobacterium rhinotracheale]MRJ07571.1 DUF5053 domain-containing protein [Ornithobacterium rhinotracheale]UOH78170.1 DUF5053 domain-containing protein [Ornithobacterium rhinotracheale]
MKEKVLELKRRYVAAKTDKERETIDQEMRLLMQEDGEAWAEAMLESAKDTAQRAENLVTSVRAREQLEDVLPILPLSYIAKVYFNKSRQWLYQKVNGSIVNGKQSNFTEEEVNTFNKALSDLGKKLQEIKVTL